MLERVRERQIGSLTDQENAEAAADGICAHYLDAGEKVAIQVRQIGADEGTYEYSVDWTDIQEHRRTMK